MSGHDATASEPTRASEDAWDYRHLMGALVAAVVLQAMFLPCLCAAGTAAITLALVYDGLVLVRIAVARLRQETGRGWIFYVVLLYTSPVWMMLIHAAGH